jgi:uncharacterized membrane protein YeaQ/YmgE (transglycosylase-associated protein family)
VAATRATIKIRGDLEGIVLKDRESTYRDGSREGLLMMVVLGIVGGLVGGFVATSVLKIGSVNGINIESIVIATIGAIVVVFAARLATGSRGLSRS